MTKLPRMSVRCRLILVCLLSVLIACFASLAFSQTRITQGVRETVFKNGLRVLTKEDHSAPVVAVYISYRVGSRNETSGQTGVSHLIEHLMFKGTAKLKSGDIDRLTVSVGGSNNAWTGPDVTSYYETLPASELETALRIEADRMVNARFAQADINAERTVVLSELEGGENNPDEALYDLVRATAFTSHPYANPVIGRRWDLRQLDRAKIVAYYKQHYVPKNATLVMVGAFRTESALKLARRYFERIPGGGRPRVELTPEPAQQGERRVELRRTGGASSVLVSFHIPKYGHPDLAVLEVAASLLSTGKNSRLYRGLVDTGIASSVGAWAETSADPSVFMVSATATAEDSDARRVESAALEALEKLKTQSVTPAELAKAKNQARASAILSKDGVSGLADLLGYVDCIGGWRSIDQNLERAMRVTEDDIIRVARKYFTAENRTVGHFIPTAPGSSVSVVPGERSCRNRHFRSVTRQPSALLKATRPQRFRLSNGLTLIVQENHSLPIVSMRVSVRAGAMYDAAEKRGAASLTAAMLDRGSTTMTAEEIAESVESVGASLEFVAGSERITGRASLLSEHLPIVAKIVAETLIRPTFPDDKFGIEKQAILTSLKERASETGVQAEDAVRRALYPIGHPYRFDPDGTVESVTLIVRDDLASFHAQRFRPSGTTIVVVGDVSASAVRRIIEAEFGEWEESPVAPSPTVLPPTPLRAPVVQHVPIADKAQTNIAIGFLGPSRRSLDYYAVVVLNDILGSDVLSRMYRRLRDQLGLAYYAYTAVGQGSFQPLILFRAGVNPSNIQRTLNEARRQIEAIATRGVTAAELAVAKRHLIGSLPIEMATNRGVADALLNMEVFGLGLDYARKWPAIINAVTKSQVNDAARKYLRLGGSATATAGTAPSSR